MRFRGAKTRVGIVLLVFAFGIGAGFIATSAKQAIASGACSVCIDGMIDGCKTCAPKACTPPPGCYRRAYIPATHDTCVDWDRDGKGHCLATNVDHWEFIDSTTQEHVGWCSSDRCSETSGDGELCGGGYKP